MKSCIITFGLWFILFFNSCYCLKNNKTDNISKDIEQYNKMLKLCENYVLSYTPLYVVDSDTMVVARFNYIPDSINSFLIQCADNGDYQPLKYAILLVMKQNDEYAKINHSDFVIWDGLLLEKNGFIILLCKAMGITYFEYDKTDLSLYTPYYTGDFCLWANKHKQSIPDYKFITKHYH